MQKFIRIFLLFLIIIGFILIYTEGAWVPKLVDKITSSDKAFPVIKTTPQKINAIKITTQTIKETNFSGTYPSISGNTNLDSQMRSYIKAQIDDFKKQANTDVPAMRKEFGPDSPPATYTIDISTKYIKATDTESLVTDIYTYTGGAHGSTVYKVMTANKAGKILKLSEVIKTSEQSNFVAFVKKALNAWRPEGSDSSPLFPEDVSALGFSSFTNFSFDEQNLNIYFDQYAIGPSVVGAIVFPLPLVDIKSFLN